MRWPSYTAYEDEYGVHFTLVARCPKCGAGYSFSPTSESKSREPEEGYDPADDMYD